MTTFNIPYRRRIGLDRFMVWVYLGLIVLFFGLRWPLGASWLTAAAVCGFFGLVLTGLALCGIANALDRILEQLHRVRP